MTSARTTVPIADVDAAPADPSPLLSPAQRRRLRAAAALVIPASAEFGVPGADDDAIAADIERR